MQVVEVIPLVKGIAKESLSYFTKEHFEPGSFVKIPLRKGFAIGLVIRSTPAAEAKLRVRTSTFALKKLSRVERAGTLSPAFLTAAQDTAEYYAASLGAVLAVLLPKLFLEFPQLLSQEESRAEPFHEIKLIQLPEEERFAEYKSLIRQNFAQKHSVFLCVPTREDGERLAKMLSSGIEQYVFTTLRSTSKKLRERIEKAKNESHPILFISTPAFIAFDRLDLKTIIFERENSRLYHTHVRPFLRWRTFLYFLAKQSGKTVIFGDTVLSLETLEKEHKNIYGTLTPLTWRIKFAAPAKVVDMRQKNFEVISPALHEMIAHALEQKQNVFLFGVRKGLAPTTVCGDCGSLLLCKNCGAPVVLHPGPIYICHHCGTRRDPSTRCDNCGSWKLTPLGIGVDRIHAEVRKLFPEASIYMLDKDHTPTARKAKATASLFSLSSGSILIGTELALLYIHEAAYTGIVSLDSLFSIPDFTINEQIFYLVSRARQMTTDFFLIQSRNVGSDILYDSTDGNILDFYRKEIKEREELIYPPFALFIKVSCVGSQEVLEKQAVQLQNIFHDDSPHFIYERKQGRRILSMLLRLKKSEWPKQSIIEKLALLSQQFLIKVDPDSIL